MAEELLDFEALSIEAERMFPGDMTGIILSMDQKRTTVSLLNQALRCRNWMHIEGFHHVLIQSPLRDTDREEMKILVGLIEITEDIWDILKEGQNEDSVLTLILNVINTVIRYGDNAALSRCLGNDGISVFVSLYKRCTNHEQLLFITMSLDYIVKKNYQETMFVKDIIPVFQWVAQKVKTNVFKKGCHLTFLSTSLLYEICNRVNASKLREMINYGIISFLADALELLPLYTKPDDKDTKVELFIRAASVLNKICQSEKSINLKAGEILPVLRGLMKTTKLCREKPCFLLYVLSVVQFIVLNSDRRRMIMGEVAKANTVSVITEEIKELSIDNESDIYTSVMFNTMVVLNNIFKSAHGQCDLTSVTQIFPYIEKNVSARSQDYDNGYQIGQLLNEMLQHASKHDLEAMLQNNLVTIVMKIFEAHHDFDTALLCLNTVFGTILRTADNKLVTRQLKPFVKLLVAQWQYWRTDYLKYGLLLDKGAFAIAAASENKKDGVHLDGLVTYFDSVYQDLKKAPVDEHKLCPSGMLTFAIKKLLKLKDFQPTVLQHMWFMVGKGIASQILEMFDAIEMKSVVDTDISLKSKEIEILKFVLVETKKIIEAEKDESVYVLRHSTKFLVEITSKGSDQFDDDILSLLKDIVSPCRRLLQNRNNTAIITNVKKYIKNLHH